MFKVNFDENWEFIESPLVTPPQILTSKLSWRKIDLPHDAVVEKERNENNPSGADEGFTPGLSLFYKKDFILEDPWKEKNLILEFEGVMGLTEVFINEVLVYKHYNNYTSFLIDITKYLKPKDKNVILVHADTSIKPSSRWYLGAGIYRHIWLHVGDILHIKPWELHVISKVLEDNKALIKIKTCLKKTLEEDVRGKICFQVLSREGEILKEKWEDYHINNTHEKYVYSEFELENFRYWDIEDPYLYKLNAKIFLDGREIDNASTNFGIRKIELNLKEGFKLNGRIIKLRGGCIHHDNGLLGSASYDRAEERKVEILKRNGFNAIRTAHNPFSPSFLDACDRLGMLVIEEFFDVWACGKRTFDYHLYFDKYWEEDIENTIKRDFNHPSIIIWSLGNEITWGAGVNPEDKESYWSIHKGTEKLAQRVKDLDPTRFITQAICHFPFEYEGNIEFFEEGNLLYRKIKNEVKKDDKWGRITEELYRFLDIIGYNYKHERYKYDYENYPKRIICGTETFPYTIFDSWKETLKYPNVIGDFVWTAMDYLGEAGIGRVSLNEEDFQNFLGKFPWFISNCGDIDIWGDKRPQSYYRDILWGIRKDPIIFILPPDYYGKKIFIKLWAWEPVERSYTFPNYEGKPTQVFVYSHGDEIELFLNGKSLGRKIAGEKVKLKTIYDIIYEPGILETVAYKNGKIIGVDKLETTEKPYKLKLMPEKSVISSNYGDLCYIKIVALDEKEREVPYANNKIRIEVEGVLKLIALGNSNPCSTEIFVNPVSSLYKGKALAILKSIGKSGETKVRVVSGELLGDEVSIKAI